MDLLLALVATFALVSAQSVRNPYLALAPKYWSESRLRPRIYNGKEARAHSIPYQVYLQTYNDESKKDPAQNCGGVLISGDYVLTAASCLRCVKPAHKYEDPKVVDVILGAHNVNESEPTQQKFESTEFTWHEEFDENGQRVNDIAFVKLPETVSFDENIKPVVLPKKSDAFTTYEGEVGQASGWGLAQEEQGTGVPATPVKVLNVMTASVIANEDCATNASRALSYKINPTNICTFADKSGMGSTCIGDKGGPLTVDGTLVGIISTQKAACQTEKYTAYTRVTSYLEWIQSNTGVEIQ